jgi:hypothetical protein
MDFAVLARIAKVVAIVGFLLPWVTYSCSGQPLLTATGFDLATGQLAIHNPMNGAIEQHSGAPDVWLTVAGGVIILGLLIGLLGGARDAAGLMLITSLAALALSVLGMQSAHNLRQQQASANSNQVFDQAAVAMVTVQNRSGYYVTLISLVTAAVLCVAELANGPAPRTAKMPARSPPKPAAPSGQGPDADLAFWDGMADRSDPDLLEEYLVRYPRGRFADLARKRLDRSSKVLDPPSSAVASAPAMSAFCPDCGKSIEFESKFCEHCGSDVRLTTPT